MRYHMYKIALVEDDVELRTLIAQMLNKYGFEVIEIEDFENAIERLMNIEPDVILLDINLPYYDGFEICKALRSISNVPILIISARNSEVEQVMGMELGADDYVIKPFSMAVLRAKIMACMRRVTGSYTNEPTQMKIGDFLLDSNTFQMIYKDDKVELTKNEFRIMKCLAENVNSIVKREDMLRELWDDTEFVDNNTLNVNISRVKAKLREIGIREAIQAKRGHGYIFTAYWLEEQNE